MESERPAGRSPVDLALGNDAGVLVPFTGGEWAVNNPGRNLPCSAGSSRADQHVAVSDCALNNTLLLLLPPCIMLSSNCDLLFLGRGGDDLAGPGPLGPTGLQ